MGACCPPLWTHRRRGCNTCASSRADLLGARREPDKDASRSVGPTCHSAFKRRATARLERMAARPSSPGMPARRNGSTTEPLDAPAPDGRAPHTQHNSAPTQVARARGQSRGAPRRTHGAKTCGWRPATERLGGPLPPPFALQPSTLFGQAASCGKAQAMPWHRFRPSPAKVGQAFPDVGPDFDQCGSKLVRRCPPEG